MYPEICTIFSLSYNEADRDWARWLAWTLEEAGSTVTLPGSGVYLDPGLREACVRRAYSSWRVLVVLSPDYLRDLHLHTEWTTALARDPEASQGTLVCVRVRPCEPGLVFQPYPLADLIGLPERRAREVFLSRALGTSSGDGLPQFMSPLPQSMRTVQARAPFPGIPHLRSVPLSGEPTEADAPLPNRRLLHALGRLPEERQDEEAR